MTIESSKRQLIASVALDFPSVAGNAIEVLTATVQNVRVGDACVVTAPATVQVAAIAAQGTLSLPVIAANTETVTIDTKVYTFEDTLTNVDGNVLVGVDAAASQAALYAALTLGAGAGTLYATATTAHPTVTMGAFAANDAILTAITPGAAGNSIATTETLGGAGNQFDAATLGTTTAGEDERASNLIFDGQVTAEHTVTIRAINPTVTAADPVSGVFDILIWR